MAKESAPKGDVQKQVDDEQAKGYLGTKVDPRPNNAYSMESGPDSPSAVEDDVTRIDQPLAGKEG